MSGGAVGTLVGRVLIAAGVSTGMGSTMLGGTQWVRPHQLCAPLSGKAARTAGSSLEAGL